jgi:hypothetical protein
VVTAPPREGIADTPRMDDSFAYRSTLPPGPRVAPWVVKAAVVSGIVVLAVALFARWVVESERASFARGMHPVVPAMRVGQIEGAFDGSATDADAEEATRIALASARAVAATSGSLLDADPARLSALQPGYTYVDGPSSTPEIVSVAADRGTWAAAVLGPSGTCYWIRTDADGHVTTGTSSECIGLAALGRDGDGTTVRADLARG